MGELHSAYKATPVQTVVDVQLRLEAYERYKAIYNDFTRASVVASVVCGKSVSDQLSPLDLTDCHMAGESLRDNVAASWAKVEEFTHGDRVQMAIRVELGIGPP